MVVANPSWTSQNKKILFLAGFIVKSTFFKKNSDIPNFCEGKIISDCLDNGLKII